LAARQVDRSHSHSAADRRDDRDRFPQPPIDSSISMPCPRTALKNEYTTTAKITTKKISGKSEMPVDQTNIGDHPKGADKTAPHKMQ
jgi:hypothetical protein